MTGWKLVRYPPTEAQVAKATLWAAFNEPSPEDFRLANAAIPHMPPTDHPDQQVVLADIIRDYRAMIAASPPVGEEEELVDGLYQMIYAAFCSPPSGPVVWTPEKVAELDNRTADLTRAILRLLNGEE